MGLLSRLRLRKARSPFLADRYPQFSIGRGSYGDLNVVEFGEGTTLKVGNYCSFARGAQVMLGGNPARAIRTRFAPEVVEKLLALRWWDWPDERIAAAMPLLLSDRIEDFLEAAEKGQV